MLTKQDMEFIGQALNRAACAFATDASELSDGVVEKRALINQAVYALKLANRLQEELNVISALNHIDERLKAA